MSYFASEIKKKNVNLVIDIGNTVAKLAVFDGDKVVEVLRGSNHSLDWLSMLCNKYPIKEVSLHQSSHSVTPYDANWLEFHLKLLSSTTKPPYLSIIYTKHLRLWEWTG